jgi:hypothetical protein
MISTVKLFYTAFSFILFDNFSSFVTTERFDPYGLDQIYRVDKVLTPVTQEKIMETLCNSHIAEYKKIPNANRLSMSWAQISLENSRGKKVWNNNLGNQGPFKMNQEYYYHLRRGWPYRSFKSLEESGSSYWRIINKCSSALNAFDAGHPAIAAISLKNCNYYDSNVESYTNLLKSLYYEGKYKILPKINCGKKDN